MNKRGECRQHAGINPKGNAGGPEYNQASLHMSGRKVPLPAGESPKNAMRDGPFGGKVKA